MNNNISSQKIHIEDGSSIVSNIDGSAELNLTEIKSVGIRNLSEVLEHRVNRFLKSSSHMVRFVNGGVLKFAYSEAGELIELSSIGLIASVSKENMITYYV